MSTQEAFNPEMEDDDLEFLEKTFENEETDEALKQVYFMHLVVASDVSGSMQSQNKISEANSALQTMYAALSDPKIERGLEISLTTFNHETSLEHYAEKPSQVALPTMTASGLTDFTKMLMAGRDVIQRRSSEPVPQGLRPMRPAFIIMSDGFSDLDDRVLAEVQEVADVYTIAFGSGADHKMLNRMATNGHCYTASTAPGELAEIMKKVGKTATAPTIS